MVRRHKILLGFLLKTPRALGRTHIMKWIFLLKNETCLSSDNSFYHFVPYKFGPCSFTIYRDMETLARQGYVSEKNWTISDHMISETLGIFDSLSPMLQKAIDDTIERYGNYSRDELVRYVYSHYDWYATRSELTAAPRPSFRGKEAVYTAGYEGRSIDLFLQELLKAGIQRVIDVRSRPFSRKYGFSKATLGQLCQGLDIQYTHIPELGIPRARRASTKTPEDVFRLLTEYEHSILPMASSARRKASRLLQETPSVLICFESDPSCCHRSRLANAIASDTGLNVVHL